MNPFIGGILKAFDLSGALQIFHTPLLDIPDASYFTDDAKALEADWQAVGDDMRAAMSDFDVCQKAKKADMPPPMS